MSGKCVKRRINIMALLMLAGVFLLGMAVSSGCDGAPTPTATSLPSALKDRIAFTSDRIHYSKYHGHAATDVCVMDADGSNVANLTENDEYGDGGPAWSPDGSRIVFVSHRDSGGKAPWEWPIEGNVGGGNIYVMEADGSNETRLTNNPFRDGNPTWSPDGTRIAFQRKVAIPAGVGTFEHSTAIYVMNADGSERTYLTNTPYNDTYPVWSPDGTHIAFQSNRDGNPEIYVMDTDGSNVTNLTKHPAADENPAWSPGGFQILFIRDTDIYVMNADGSNVTNLTNHPVYDENPAWSPDGTHIAFNTRRDETERDNNSEIYVMNADGTGLTRLTHDPHYDECPVWSPDGSRIAFVSNRDWNREIYVMDADGSNQTNLTNNPAYDQSPVWSPGP